MDKKYIFLDFDGVMHPDGKQAFSCAEYFADCIKDKNNLFIVFSTSWREYSTIEKLSSYLPSSIRNKCIGKTPLLKNHYKHVRYHEIMAYNSEKLIGDNNWIALDDMAIIFPPNCKNLILTNPRNGFGEREAHLVHKFYENNFF